MPTQSNLSVASNIAICKHYWAAVLIFIFPTLWPIYMYICMYMYIYMYVEMCEYVFKIQSVSIQRAIYQSLRSPNYKKMKALLEVPLPYTPPPLPSPGPPTQIYKKKHLDGVFVVAVGVVVVNFGYLISY